MRNRVPGRWRLLRILLLLTFLSAGRGVFGGSKLQDVPYVPGTDNTLVLVALVGGIVVIGGVLAYRAGMLPGTSSVVRDGDATAGRRVQLSVLRTELGALSQPLSVLRDARPGRQRGLVNVSSLT